MQDNKQQAICLRFAPSNNGYLHLGHAYSALLNQQFAQKNHGTLLLRIEDIDQTRCNPYFENTIKTDLAWLGIDFPKPIRRQSEHFALYNQALQKLIDLGLVYKAFMSRAMVKKTITQTLAKGIIWPRDPDGNYLYPENERDLEHRIAEDLSTKGQAFAWRLNMQKAMQLYGQELYFYGFELHEPQKIIKIKAQPELWGDVIIARKECKTSYHLSVVLDDDAQNISHIIRGQDLFHATSIHCLLQRILALKTPFYHHHRLIYDAYGEKLSKSHNDKNSKDFNLQALRQKGLSPEDIKDELPLCKSGKSH